MHNIVMQWEKNMKKTVKLLCVLLSTLMLAFSFVACGDAVEYSYWQTYTKKAGESKLAYVSELSFGSSAVDVTEVWVNVSGLKEETANIHLLFAKSTTSTTPIDCPIYASKIKESKDGWIQIYYFADALNNDSSSGTAAYVSAKGVSIEIVSEMQINEIVFIKADGTLIVPTFTQGGVKILDSNSANLYTKSELEKLAENNLAYNENPAYNVIDEQDKFPVEKIQTKK